MTEFKVGDRVRVLTQDFEGREGTVTYVSEVVDVLLDGPGDEIVFGPEELEHVSVSDAVNPSHYAFPGGVQVIDITRHLGFLEGNAVKYLCRAGRKGDRLEDLKKARKYIDYAIEDAERS